MRVATPEIALHVDDHGKNGPVYGVDVHPKLRVMVTGGSDNEIKFWTFGDADLESESPFTFICGFQAHHKSVNAARFSPDGSMLATCSDDGTLCIFKPEHKSKDNSADTNSTCILGWDEIRDERDVKRKFLRGHTSDVMDLAWASDSRMLVSGSVDGSVIVWDAVECKVVQSHHEHGHFVQGVAWDPFRHHFASCSADRTVKVFKQRVTSGKTKSKSSQKSGASADGTTGANCAVELPKFSVAHELTHRQYPDKSRNSAQSDEAEEDALQDVSSTMHRRQIFQHDTVPTMVRRLSWSPDGSLLITPTGQIRHRENTTYCYLRGAWQSPALHFPGTGSASVGVRFSPVLYELLPGAKPWLNVPYRMVFAIITLDSVFVYDTQHLYAIAAAENLHFAELTDIAWGDNGQALIVSSRDGYCSLVSMEDGEIGTPLPQSKIPAVVNGDVRLPVLIKPEDRNPAKTNISTPQRKKSVASPLRVESKEVKEPISSEDSASVVEASPQTSPVRPSQDAKKDDSRIQNEASESTKKRRITPTNIQTFFKAASGGSKFEPDESETKSSIQEDKNDKPQAAAQESPAVESADDAATTKTLQRRRITPVQVQPYSPATSEGVKSESEETPKQSKKKIESVLQDQEQLGQNTQKKRRIAPTIVEVL